MTETQNEDSWGHPAPLSNVLILVLVYQNGNLFPGKELGSSFTLHRDSSG